ncbi:glycosyltransferase family 2 protein [uncultured Arcobacter sp.]|uniref:glycosyltransferase family 2 protein n=1 Tax=uncultured Arcobacter sp. TaxID=165434 RepID=UPI00261F2988|nr:glycosyltransferase family 2 protein [uncultured Arcobacter sp.]
MTNIKVSVVTVTYNAERYLNKTIKSIIEQDYPNIEYIIIDGASSDNSVDTIKEYKENISYWISEPDFGIYDAMNKGIEKATGEWILFMNAGDTFFNSSTITDFINNVNIDTELYNGAINFVDENKITYKPPHGLEKVWVTVPCWHQASFIKTSLMKKCKYSLEYKIAGDHDFYLKCFINNNKFQFTNKIIANMLAGGLHKQQAKLAQIESIKIIANYAPNIDLVYDSTFYKNFSIKQPIDNKLLFSRQFSQLFNQLENIKNNYKNIILYGYGTLGKNIELLLKEKIVYITDRNTNISQETKKFISISKIKNINFDILLISVLGREKEILKNLEKENVDLKKIKIFEI